MAALTLHVDIDETSLPALVAGDLVRVSVRLNVRVQGVYRGVPIAAEPSMTARQVLDHYYRMAAVTGAAST